MALSLLPLFRLRQNKITSHVSRLAQQREHVNGEVLPTIIAGSTFIVSIARLTVVARIVGAKTPKRSLTLRTRALAAP